MSISCLIQLENNSTNSHANVVVLGLGKEPLTGHNKLYAAFQKGQRVPISSSHVLICRTDNIGDVVLTLPITAYLKKHYPSIKISFMCRAYAAPIVRMCNTVDTVVEAEAVWPDPVTYFKTCGADTVIFAQPDYTLALSAFKAGIPHRIGNAHPKFFQLLLCNRRVWFSKRNSPLHEAQINFLFLQPFGLTQVPEIAEIIKLYDFKESDAESVPDHFDPHVFNLILHPKSNKNGREWPIHHFQTLAQELGSIDTAKMRVQCWITGSKDEGAWIESHAPDLLRMSNVRNMCGQLSLNQLIALIRHADGLIASGTGPLHIAAAVGQRTLGLFPPLRSMNPSRWGPVGKQAQVLCKPTGCEDCAKRKNRRAMTCECMRNILPEEVLNVVSKWASLSLVE